MHYKRFHERYSWINFSFTRLQVLNAARQLGFHKILFLDADVLVVGDLSPVFELEAPAGILSQNPPSDGDDFLEFNHKDMHGRKLSDAMVELSVRTCYGVRGCIQLLSTGECDFLALVETLTCESASDFAVWCCGAALIGRYGDFDHFIGPDERLLTEVLQKLYGWTHIHRKYCMTSWHANMLEEGEQCCSLHFVSQKPWDRGDCYPDFDTWFEVLKESFAHCPELFECLPVSTQRIDRFRSSMPTEWSDDVMCVSPGVMTSFGHHPLVLPLFNEARKRRLAIASLRVPPVDHDRQKRYTVRDDRQRRRRWQNGGQIYQQQQQRQQQHTSEHGQYASERQQHTREHGQYTSERQQHTSEHGQHTSESQQHTSEHGQYTSESQQQIPESQQQICDTQQQQCTSEPQQQYISESQQQQQ